MRSGHGRPCCGYRVAPFYALSGIRPEACPCAFLGLWTRTSRRRGVRIGTTSTACRRRLLERARLLPHHSVVVADLARDIEAQGCFATPRHAAPCHPTPRSVPTHTPKQRVHDLFSRPRFEHTCARRDVQVAVLVLPLMLGWGDSISDRWRPVIIFVDVVCWLDIGITFCTAVVEVRAFVTLS